MRSSRLLQLIGEVDPAFVDITPIEDYPPKKRPFSWAKWVAIAACVTVFIAGGMAFLLQSNGTHTIVYPDENAVCVQSKDIPLSVAFKESFTYAELAEASEFVIVADVTAIEKTGENKAFRRMATVKIVEALKGTCRAGDTLCVLDNVFWRDGCTSDGGPMLECGNRVLLFLSSAHLMRDGEMINIYTYTRVMPSLGKFFYDRDGRYHESRTYAEEFTQDSREMMWDRFFDDYEPKTLEEIKSLLNISKEESGTK